MVLPPCGPMRGEVPPPPASHMPTFLHPSALKLNLLCRDIRGKGSAGFREVFGRLFLLSGGGTEDFCF